MILTEEREHGTWGKGNLPITYVVTFPLCGLQVSNAKLDVWGSKHGAPKIIVATGVRRRRRGRRPATVFGRPRFPSLPACAPTLPCPTLCSSLCPYSLLPPGFIAKNPSGQVTTLKRNGSDYSATIFGALFRVGRLG